jgi:hypothetical protein
MRTMGQCADLRLAVPMRYPVGKVGAPACSNLAGAYRKRAKVLDDPFPAVQAGWVEQRILRVGLGFDAVWAWCHYSRPTARRAMR